MPLKSSTNKYILSLLRFTVSKPKQNGFFLCLDKILKQRATNNIHKYLFYLHTIQLKT